VIQSRIARLHGILKALEQWQSIIDERLQRLGADDGPGKTVEPSRMAGEARIDKCNYLAGDYIRLEACAGWQ